MTQVATFDFVAGLTAEIRGSRQVVDHFRAEYGPGRPARSEAEPTVRVRFIARDIADAATVEGGHKTVGWQVMLPKPSATSLDVTVSLRGRPRWFALSLVQGYIVEPVLSVAAARTGHVLVPGAAMSNNGGTVVLLGRSRSGKSTVSAIAAAAGWSVLGDDQFFLAGDGACYRLPRRFRFYPDLRETAPRAYARLPVRHRLGLGLRRLVKTATRGWVSPSLAVSAADLGQAQFGAAGLGAGRIVIIRRAATDRVEREAVPAEVAVEEVRSLLRDQRRAIAVRAEPAWADALDRTEALEAATLRSALAGRSIERLTLPSRWSAADAVSELARVLGVLPERAT